jgi:hypothetical protein
MMRLGRLVCKIIDHQYRLVGIPFGALKEYHWYRCRWCGHEVTGEQVLDEIYPTVFGMYGCTSREVDEARWAD